MPEAVGKGTQKSKNLGGPLSRAQDRSDPTRFLAQIIGHHGRLSVDDLLPHMVCACEPPVLLVGSSMLGYAGMPTSINGD